MNFKMPSNLWSCGLQCRNCTRLEIHLKAVTAPVWRCTWRPWSSEFGDTLEGGDCGNVVAVIVQLWRYTWRRWSNQFEDALGGHDRVRLEAYQEEFILEAVIQDGARRDNSWDSIQWSTRNCANVENWVQHGLPRDEGPPASGRQSMMGWCSTRCMQYPVFAVLSVCWTRFMLYSVYVGKSFGATITEIIYPCYHCVTVAYYRLWLPTMYCGD